MVTTVQVIIKDEDKTFRRKFLVYENDQQIRLTSECCNLRKMVDQALSEFKCNPEDIIIKTEMIWK
jgi:hypothetical protein